MSEQGNAQSQAGAGGTRNPEEIRAEIDETRAELGETVTAVAEKTDVKKQAQARAEEVKEQAGEKAQEAKAKAEILADKAREAAPESATEGVQQARRITRENPVSVGLAGAFVAGFLLGRLLSR
jgi:ElaB/YqjD/DUF883 family membrane-anchored ribosome-binding protein